MNLHGVLMRVAGCGVLISGPAGSGKSQLGLELLSRGHLFVADDLILARRAQQHLFGQGVAECARFLSLRCGLVVDVQRQFGKQSSLTETSIDLVVAPGPARHLGQPALGFECLELERPLYPLGQLPGSAIVIEALARDWLDRQQGYDAASELDARCRTRLQASG